jgi:hypothetical protein
MDTPARNLDEYRRQLTEWALAMAVGHNGSVPAALAEGSLPAQVELFTDGNLEKRYEKLQKQLEFVAGAFDDLNDLINDYIENEPLAAYDTGDGDGERFLLWLERQRPLTAEQRDHVTCQRARHAVEDVARKDRRGHVRFQERWSVATQLAAELETNARLRICLNPIRVAARFETAALLDEDAALPADVLFFPVGNSVRTAVLEPGVAELLEELAGWEPCTLAQWACLSRHADRDELVALSRDLAEMGLVAFC